MTRDFEAALGLFLDELPNRRVLRNAIPRPNGMVAIDGRHVVDFSSNDYLGLSHHPRIIRAVQDWTGHHAAGSTASRLITGNHPACQQIESRIAQLKQKPAALLMSSGFVANSTVLAALLDRQLHGRQTANRNVQVFADRLVHASIHFGLAAAGVRQHRFRHNDMHHLEQLLQDNSATSGCRMIVTESVFSMNGDVADIEALRQLASRHKALLFIDEAHATGMIGDGGRGLAGEWANRPAGSSCQEVVIGTFGKALGSFGAFVACSETVREFLINRCHGLIYSTALPPGILGALDAALDMISEMDDQRSHVQRLAARFRRRVNHAGIDTLNSSTWIVPVLIGDADMTVSTAAELLDLGFLTSAIRPPTVPSGQSRLRISFSAAHREDQVDALCEAILRVTKCQTTA